MVQDKHWEALFFRVVKNFTPSSIWSWNHETHPESKPIFGDRVWRLGCQRSFGSPFLWRQLTFLTHSKPHRRDLQCVSCIAPTEIVTLAGPCCLTWVPKLTLGKIDVGHIPIDTCWSHLITTLSTLSPWLLVHPRHFLANLWCIYWWHKPAPGFGRPSGGSLALREFFWVTQCISLNYVYDTYVYTVIYNIWYIIIYIYI